MSRWVHAGIKAVFFDAVGTLIFPTPSAVVVYSATAFRAGLDLSHEVIRDRFLAAYRAEERADEDARWVTSEEREVARWRRIVHETLAGVPDPEACFRELFDHFALPSAWMVNPDAAEVFTSLRPRGVVLGLASNYDSRLLSVMAGHEELASLRDRVVISATVGYRKPAPQFFAEVARVADCCRSEVLLVGDDIENDYYGAIGTGLEAVLLYPRPDASAPRPPVARAIHSLRELL